MNKVDRARKTKAQDIQSSTREINGKISWQSNCQFLASREITITWPKVQAPYSSDRPTIALFSLSRAATGYTTTGWLSSSVSNWPLIIAGQQRHCSKNCFFGDYRMTLLHAPRRMGMHLCGCGRENLLAMKEFLWWSVKSEEIRNFRASFRRCRGRRENR